MGVARQAIRCCDYGMGGGGEDFRAGADKWDL